MKKFILSTVFAAMVAFVPTSSFAIFDIGVYGGYGFTSIPDASSTLAAFSDPGGWDYGAVAHINIKIPFLMSFGFGAYYQGSYFDNIDFAKLNAGGTQFAIQSKDAVGLSFYAQLDLIPVVKPFIRITVAIWEGQKMGSIDATSFDSTPTVFDFFMKTYSIGPGLAFKIGIIDIFVDYMFNFTLNFGDVINVGNASGVQLKDATSHTFHAGVRLNI